MVAAVRLMIDKDPYLSYQQSECSPGDKLVSNLFNSPRLFIITKGLRTMGAAFAHQRSKTTSNSVLSPIIETNGRSFFMKYDLI